MMRREITLKFGRAIHLPVRLRPAAIIGTLLVLLFATSLAALRFGSTPISTTDIIHWLLSVEAADAEITSIMDLRWPRITAALLGGAMVAASGYLLQVVARNGLADPGLLGISQGSMAAIVIGVAVFGLAPSVLVWLGLAGGFATAILVMTLAYRLASSTGLILVGLAVGIVLSAAIEIVMVQGGILQFARWLSWSHGSLTAVSAGNAGMLAVWSAVLVPVSLIASGKVMPLLLGHEQAAGIGASPRKLSLVLTLLAAALVAPVVAVIGPISFLGLIAAHIARRLLGERPGEVMPATMLIGALILLSADTAGRTLFSPVIIPAGILISIAGVVIFLAAARLSRSRR